MANEHPRLALTGATGFLGSHVLEAALGAGYEVAALTRRPQPPRERVIWVPGDLADTEAMAHLTRGVEAVIHVAGVVNAPDAAGFEAGNVTGTLNLLDAARLKGIRRFVHVSSLAARELGLSAYGASKARSEKLLRASALDWTIVRPPAIYGPRDKEMFELFRAARWGVVPVPAQGRASMIHAADLARLLIALVPGGEGVTGQTFEPDDGRAGGWEHREMARAIGWAMGRRPFVPGLTPAMLARIARFDGLVRGAKAKMTPDRAAYFSHPDWVSNPSGAVPAALWTPQIPTRDGLKQTAQWYRKAGWL